MMTAANVDFGINRNESVKNPSDNITRTPVTIPPSVVRTPLALLTAVRVNEPVTGIDCTKAPTKLHIPSANISCVASIVLPFAVGHNDSNSLNDQNDSISISFIWRRYLQNAFATAILSRIDVSNHFKRIERLIANGRMHRRYFDIRQSRSNLTYGKKTIQIYIDQF